MFTTFMIICQVLVHLLWHAAHILWTTNTGLVPPESLFLKGSPCTLPRTPQKQVYWMACPGLHFWVTDAPRWPFDTTKFTCVTIPMASFQCASCHSTLSGLLKEANDTLLYRNNLEPALPFKKKWVFLPATLHTQQWHSTVSIQRRWAGVLSTC